MNLSDIIQASSIIYILFISILATAVVVAIGKTKNYNINTMKTFVALFYLQIMWAIVLTPYGNSIDINLNILGETSINLLPFRTIRECLLKGEYIYLLGGILITVPVFPLWFACTPKSYKLKNSIIATFGIVLSFEVIQLLGNIVTNNNIRVVDVDDTILNLIGYGTGVVLTVLVRNRK